MPTGIRMVERVIAHQTGTCVAYQHREIPTLYRLLFICGLSHFAPGECGGRIRHIIRKQEMQPQRSGSSIGRRRIAGGGFRAVQISTLSGRIEVRSAD